MIGFFRSVLTALWRPLQASTHVGTALWASSFRSLNWLWCALWWRTTITRSKMTLWGSLLCLSPAYAQVAHKDLSCSDETEQISSLVSQLTSSFCLRLSTHPPPEGRWLQSVSSYTLCPCESEPQRTSSSNPVRAYGHC